jgi:nicotinate-nucleotide pyrophosphorylase (carboxylating)
VTRPSDDALGRPSDAEPGLPSDDALGRPSDAEPGLPSDDALGRLRQEMLGPLIDAALAEDVGSGDWTTFWTVDRDARGEAEVVAKGWVVVAGTAVALEVFRRVEPALVVEVLAPDGRRVEPGDVILRVQGPLRGILSGERTALNFLGRLSGVATLTRRFVDAVAGTGAEIQDTRKTTPGWRILEKDAVRAGGGGNHRMGLYDMVLVKDNHLAASGGVREAVERVRRENRARLPVEVEVGSLEELDEAMALGVERILLDNMAPETMAEAVRRSRALGPRRPMLEASGNVTLENVRAVAETGVDIVSVGALTHSAPAADLSLRLIRR